MNSRLCCAILLLFAVSRAEELRISVGQRGDVLTIEEAIAKARASRKSGDTVRFLISGTQYLARPILLTEADSGTTFQGTAKGATLSGGRLLQGWKRGAGQAWQLEIPEAKQGSLYFRELFVNGVRRQRARTPNYGFLNFVGDRQQVFAIDLKFRAGDIKESWAQIGDAELVAIQAWYDFHLFIRKVDSAAQVVTLSAEGKARKVERGARYFVENVPDALDSPGEWYLDRKSGVLSYWPVAGEIMSRAQTIVPTMTNLVKVTGNPTLKKAAQQINFRNITFADCDYAIGQEGYSDPAGGVNVPGDVVFEYAADCAVDDCTFTHLGGYGLEIGRGAQRMKIRNCEITDTGGGGIRIGAAARPSNAFEENHSNEVSDCRIHALSRVFVSCVGIELMQSATNVISHNEIFDLFTTGICVGWNWGGYYPTVVRDNLIEYNHVHDIGQGILSDMGGIYTVGVQPGTVVRNNLIHDVISYDYGGWGLYADEGSSGILVESNIVYRCSTGPFHQHFGHKNIFRNNILAFGKEAQLMRTRAEGHKSFTIENNIVYYDSGELLGLNWSNDFFDMDRNLYFDARPGAKVTFKGLSIEQWRHRGHDKKSIIADPLFVDAAHYDFRLRPNSPALKIGFKPFDLTTVGPRKKL